MSPDAFSCAQSTEAPSPASEPQSKKHKRAYKACDNCGQRKVKCDRGPVDKPHSPPCARCRRESEPCVFTRSQRKRGLKGCNVSHSNITAYALNGAKRRKQGQPLAATHTGSFYSTTSPAGTPCPTDQLADTEDLSDAAALDTMSHDGADEKKVNNDTTARLQHGQLYNNHDALNLLAETAVASGYAKQQRHSNIDSSLGAHSADGFPPNPYKIPRGHTFINGAYAVKIEGGSQIPRYSFYPPPGDDDAVKLWNRVRFIRAGWFSAIEGMRYVDFFYAALYPLTPITLPDFRHPSTHAKLLREEPMLALTILTIASRHILPPTRGAQQRCYKIHQRLWDHLQAMINCMFLGQDCLEKHAHGLPPLSAYHGRVLGLRTIGTIESLLLLTEWHPSMIHFPSHDFSNGIIVEEDRDEDGDLNDPSSTMGQPSRDLSDDAWRAPSYRSDAMTWSLLGTAINLAYEIGLFNAQGSAIQGRSERGENVCRLLYIFSVQTCGRLSIPSMISEEQWAQAITGFNRVHGAYGRLPPASEDSSEHDSTVSQAYAEGTLLHFWFRLARLFSKGNKKLWSSHSRAHEIVERGNYAAVLDDLAQEHEQWRRDFDACTLIPAHSRWILDIEYYYMRVHGNNIALQAVVERCVNVAPQDMHQVIAHNIFEGCMGDDRKYIDMITSDSRRLLRCVVEGLHGNGSLAHVSNRTFWRIANVATILLKTLAFGSSRDDLAESLDLLDDASQVLSNNAVDDLHIATQVAELLQSITARVRANLIPIAQPKSDKHKRARPGRRARSSRHDSLETSTAATSGSHKPQASVEPTSHLPPIINTLDLESQERGGRDFAFPLPNVMDQNHQYDFPPLSASFYRSLEDNGTSTPAFAQYGNFNHLPPGAYGPFTSDEGHNSMLLGASSPRPGSPRFHRQEWYGLDLSSLNGCGEVRQSEAGPIINGQDMLDVITPNNPPTSANPNGVPSDWGNFGAGD